MNDNKQSDFVELTRSPKENTCGFCKKNFTTKLFEARAPFKTSKKAPDYLDYDFSFMDKGVAFICDKCIKSEYIKGFILPLVFSVFLQAPFLIAMALLQIPDWLPVYIFIIYLITFLFLFFRIVCPEYRLSTFLGLVLLLLITPVLVLCYYLMFDTINILVYLIAMSLPVFYLLTIQLYHILTNQKTLLRLGEYLSWKSIRNIPRYELNDNIKCEKCSNTKTCWTYNFHIADTTNKSFVSQKNTSDYSITTYSLNLKFIDNLKINLCYDCLNKTKTKSLVVVLIIIIFSIISIIFSFKLSGIFAEFALFTISYLILIFSFVEFIEQNNKDRIFYKKVEKILLKKIIKNRYKYSENREPLKNYIWYDDFEYKRFMQ